MSEQQVGQFSMVYNGPTNPYVTSINVTGLTTGLAYSFYVQAINFNGVGAASNEVFAYVCLPPWGIAVP
jgi:hypothetical protein